MNEPNRVAFCALLIAALLGSACRSGPYPVTRVMGGERRAGVFVSPYAYEHFVRAELASAQGDDEIAARQYQLARAGSVEDPYLTARYAGALMRLLRLEEAERVLAEGAVIDPQSEAIAIAQGDLHRMRSDDEAAVASYVRAAEFAPRSDVPILRLAALMQSVGAAGRALEALASGSSPARLRAALTLAVARGDAASAGRTAERLSRIAPVYAADIADAAQLALSDNRPMLALHLLRHPLLGDDRLVPLRARALLATGRRDLAETLVVSSSDRAIPDSIERVRLFFEVGRPDLALELAEIASAEGDERARIWVAAASLALLNPTRAAQVAAGIPRDASDGARATEILIEALQAGGLPTLAEEVRSARDVPTTASGPIDVSPTPAADASEGAGDPR